MALLKSITLPSNIVAEYHKVSGAFILDHERVCEIHLQSWVDEDTRRETVELEEPQGATAPKWQPAATPVVRIAGDDFTAVFGPGVPDYPDKTTLYNWLKADPKSPLVGAEDAL